MASPQRGHGREQRAVAQVGGRSDARQAAPEGDADSRDGQRRREVDAPPPPPLPQDAARDPREQDPEQEPGHDRPDDLAPALGRGHHRRRGHDVLGECRRHADDEGGDQERRERRRERGREQREGERSRLGEDDAAAVVAIPEGGEEEDPEGVADLRGRGDDADHRGARVEVRGEGAEERLRVVERCGPEPRAGGKEANRGAWSVGLRGGERGCLHDGAVVRATSGGVRRIGQAVTPVRGPALQ